MSRFLAILGVSVGVGGSIGLLVLLYNQVSVHGCLPVKCIMTRYRECLIIRLNFIIV